MLEKQHWAEVMAYEPNVCQLDLGAYRIYTNDDWRAVMFVPETNWNIDFKVKKMIPISP